MRQIQADHFTYPVYGAINTTILKTMQYLAKGTKLFVEISRGSRPTYTPRF